ncbi:MAG: hypothetical protein PVF37_17670 [Desulfobacterales bacterium]|jgi:HD-like signal output (HDOD) protein
MDLPKEERLGKNEIMGKIMLKVSSFPSMPQAGIKVMGLIQQKDIAIDDVVQVMRHDPGLTANQYELISEKVSNWMNKLADSLNFE